MSFSIDDMFDGATEPTDGQTYIGPGNHVLTLAEFKASNGLGEAPKFRADFVVVESDYHKPGEIISKTFKPYDNPFPGAGQKEAGRMMVMIQHLNGLALGYRESAKAEMKKMLDLSQPARGFRVAASGYDKMPKPNPDGSPKLDKYGKPKGPYTVVSFFPAPVANTAEQVMADRAKIEALPKMKARAQAAQQPAPQQAPPPQQQYQQPAPQQPPAPATVEQEFAQTAPAQTVPEGNNGW